MKTATEILEKFERVDKYRTFYKMMPEVMGATDDHQDIISNILNQCSRALLALYKDHKKPTIVQKRALLVACMDAITLSPARTEHKEFGYQLCWYLAEKVQVDLRKASDTKVWGYWKVENQAVKTVTRMRRLKGNAT